MNHLQHERSADQRLVIACQLGDAHAWDELIHRWNPKLRGFLGRMVSNPATADDLLQTTWLRIVRSIGRLRDPDRAAAWMYGIARAVVADHFRKHYRSPAMVAADGNSTADSDSAADGDPAVDSEDIFRLIESEHLATALGRLHPRDREVLVLHYFEHLPVAEIAGVCGVAVGTAKSRLSRAREVLRRILETGAPLS